MTTTVSPADIEEAVRAADRVYPVVHLTRPNGPRFIDRDGVPWPRASCGVVLTRRHWKSDSLLTVNCYRCVAADHNRTKGARLPYKD